MASRIDLPTRSPVADKEGFGPFGLSSAHVLMGVFALSRRDLGILHTLPSVAGRNVGVGRTYAVPCSAGLRLAARARGLFGGVSSG